MRPGVCGVVFLAGPWASARIAGCVERLRHRGPDDQAVWSEGHLALGFARLEINGPGPSGRQPHEHAGLVGAINGEIYNHRALAAAHGLASGPCDTHVILPLVERFGGRVVDDLDGFYAGVVLQPSTGEVLCLRDHMGKKPLFVGRSGDELFLVSELKVFDDIEWFEPLPRGASSVDVTTGEVRLLARHGNVEARSDLATVFAEAVRKRLPSPEQPVGVFLSGGLDSSLVAGHVAKERVDATCFTLGDEDGPDRRAVEQLVDALGLTNVRPVPLPAAERIPTLVSRVVHATESFNPSIISNGVATWLLAEAAKAHGVKVVLTGEGADELFGGYHRFGPDDPWRDVRARLIDDMQSTELRRLDRACMAHGVEARCPFLDRELRSYSDRLGFDELYGPDENKVALRRAFRGVLPHEALHRVKTSLDVGSGLRGQVVSYLRRHGRRERDELRDVWREHFPFDAANPYFHAYPVFDDAIDARGTKHR